MKEYYYLGLEASLRDNKYHCYEEAVQDAGHAAYKRRVPIRIFKMQPNNKAELVEIVDPGDPICKKYDKVYTP